MCPRYFIAGGQQGVGGTGSGQRSIYFTVTLHKIFVFQDLCEDDVMLLDTFTEVGLYLAPRPLNLTTYRIHLLFFLPNNFCCWSNFLNREQSQRRINPERKVHFENFAPQENAWKSDQRVPGCQSPEQLQPIRSSQLIFGEKNPKNNSHVWPTSQSIATERKMVDFDQNLQIEYWCTLIDKDRLAAIKRGNYTHLYAGIGHKSCANKWGNYTQLYAGFRHKSHSKVPHGRARSKACVDVTMEGRAKSWMRNPLFKVGVVGGMMLHS